MGKAIYQPTGKAKEYSRWACNLYVGCSNDCSYCFNKRGVLGTIMGDTVPKLKTCFKNKQEAFETYMRELKRNRDRIINDGGLLFSFSTDPCLPETLPLTMACVSVATGMDIPCQILTKCAQWVLKDGTWTDGMSVSRDLVAVGFTLTGRDDLEGGASTNMDRIEAMRILHGKGYRTFASIEPVIDFEKSLEMIRLSEPWCDLFKIGLLSGDRNAYDKYSMSEDLEAFVYEVDELLTIKKKPVYWKKSVRERLVTPVTDPCCIDNDYNIFKNN